MSDLKKGALGIGIGAIIFGIVAGVFSYFAIEKRDVFEAHGVTYQAIVTRRNKEYDEGWSYWFDYVYVDAQGNEHEAWDYVDSGEYAAARAGRTRFPVVYLPENPAQSMALKDVNSRFYEMLLIGGVVFSIIGIGVLVFATYL